MCAARAEPSVTVPADEEEDDDDDEDDEPSAPDRLASHREAAWGRPSLEGDETRRSLNAPTEIAERGREEEETERKSRVGGGVLLAIPVSGTGFRFCQKELGRVRRDERSGWLSQP